MKTALDTIKHLQPCDEPRSWLADQACPARAWEDCERGDWMLWLAGRVGADRRQLVRAAVDCAALVLHLVPDGEDRPREALEAALAYVDGECSLEDVRAAATAADAAYYTAASDCASRAADSACAAAHLAADADVDVDDAATAACACASCTADAADGYARAATLDVCADIVRRHITYEDIRVALEGAHD
jgi:hypothetical protein